MIILLEQLLVFMLLQSKPAKAKIVQASENCFNDIQLIKQSYALSRLSQERSLLMNGGADFFHFKQNGKSSQYFF